MASPSTELFSSSAYVFFDDSANFDVIASDPRADGGTNEPAGHGRMCRAILITTAGTLHTIRADGTTVDITDSIPAGVIVPIECTSIRASGTCKGLVMY